MKFQFVKMQGAGNDFILADDSSRRWNTRPEFIRNICDRHRGIGADGLILLRKTAAGSRIQMEYFNCDGSSAEMCGNGLRCAASFVYRRGMAGGDRKTTLSCGGQELATEIMSEDGGLVRIALVMREEFRPCRLENGETVYKGVVGVPHAIVLRRVDEETDVEGEGRRLRRHPVFAPDGVNVDFVYAAGETDRGQSIRIRTYERGVEGETLACGTGCASAALVLHLFFGFSKKVSLLCRGKDHIEVEIWQEGSNLKGVFLTGPAKTVFEGEIES